ncbi:MAG: HEAT repeat domain-containing protein [Gemmataceae bacterium]|nr:HEAT repeat domain-containing protein [Gemmataceae bacterium]
MKRTLSVCLAALILSGCARKAPAPMDAAVPSVVPAPLPQASEAAPAPTFEKQTPQQWADQLEGPSAADTQRAALALRELKDAGYPHLQKGLQSRSAETRLACLQAMPQSVVVAKQREMLPILMSMLGDPKWAVRRDAVVRLSWFGTQDGDVLRALRRTATGDAHPKVRAMAAECVGNIEDEMRNKGRE